MVVCALLAILEFAFVGWELVDWCRMPRLALSAVICLHVVIGTLLTCHVVTGCGEGSVYRTKPETITPVVLTVMQGLRLPLVVLLCLVEPPILSVSYDLICQCVSFLPFLFGLVGIASQVLFQRIYDNTH